MPTPAACGGGRDISHEALVLQHAGQPILRPGWRRRQLPALGPDENELDLVAVYGRFEACCADALLDAVQRAPAAGAPHGAPVLVEERARCPCEPVAQGPQRRRVNPDPLVSHNAEAFR